MGDYNDNNYNNGLDKNEYGTNYGSYSYDRNNAGSAQQSSYTYTNGYTNGYTTGYSNNDGRGGFYYSQPEQGGYNEFSYTPAKPRKTVGRKILTGTLAIIAIGAISVTSIVGYNYITGRNTPLNNAGEGISDDGFRPQSGKKDEAAGGKTTINRDNLPTLEQLAAPEDALTIPQIIEKMSPSVVGISCITTQGIATGSGIILSEDGYIITNAHVISGAQSISVVLPTEYSTSDDEDADQSELTFTAEKVGSDEQTDIAVLKIDKTGLKKAEIGVSSDVQVGELSIVIGNPLGLNLANTATAGIISAKDRTITVEDRTMKVFQTDASINSGNSGGPLINAYGQVIGITSAKVASSSVEGLGFAIPIDDALPIINDLMEKGYVTGRPSLGITGTNVTLSYASYYGIPQGFLVVTVNEGSCSQKAGVQPNDIIIAINDTIISDLNSLNDVKNKCKPGDTVTLTVYRNGRKIDLSVVLDEASGDATADDNTGSSNDHNNNYGYFNPFDYFGGY